jgi:hypothetical protein
MKMWIKKIKFNNLSINKKKKKVIGLESILLPKSREEFNDMYFYL